TASSNSRRRQERRGARYRGWVWRVASELQLVADAVDRAHELFARADVLELAAQVLHVRVDRAVGDYAVIFIQALEQPLTRKHAPGCRGESAQQAEFHGGEVERAAIERGDMALVVDDECARGGARPA